MCNVCISFSSLSHCDKTVIYIYRLQQQDTPTFNTRLCVCSPARHRLYTTKRIPNKQSAFATLPLKLRLFMSLFLSLSPRQMYGHYSELQRFAREFSAAHRAKTQPQPPGIEEAMKKMRKTYSKWGGVGFFPTQISDFSFRLLLGNTTRKSM